MKRPAIEAVWISRPSFCARISGSATVTQYSACDRLPCTSVSMPSGVSLSQCRSTMFTPALFTRMSSRPNVLLMNSPTFCTCFVSVSSAGCT